MRNDIQIKHFEKTYKNLNLLKYDHKVYCIIAFIYSVFSYSLDIVTLMTTMSLIPLDISIQVSKE